MKRRSPLSVAVLLFGYAFLYAPILALVVYSFNASERVTVWQGFSIRWYGALVHNTQILSAAWLSLRIALVSATAGLVLGTLAGFALARFRRFRGRSLFSGLVAAPLVMPDVITGLSLLLLFVTLEGALGWPQGRGAGTIMLAHTTLSSTYVAVIVQARLANFDRSLEEAALDLGARPWMAFARITLPLIAPSLAAAWLLALTLSLDDLVIASFVSGPGASTLPMVVFSKVRLGLSPEINALATLALVVVGAGILMASRIARRSRLDLREGGPQRRGAR